MLVPFIGHGRTESLDVPSWLPKAWSFYVWPEIAESIAELRAYGAGLLVTKHTYSLQVRCWPAEQHTPVRIWYAPI